MTYLYRCNRTIRSGVLKGLRCYARRSLPRRVEEYVRKPKCKACGAELTYLDKWQKKKNKATICKCDGLHYTHRKGSKWCDHYEGAYNEDEMRERHCG